MNLLPRPPNVPLFSSGRISKPRGSAQRSARGQVPRAQARQCSQRGRAAVCCNSLLAGLVSCVTLSVRGRGWRVGGNRRQTEHVRRTDWLARSNRRDESSCVNASESGLGVRGRQDRARGTFTTGEQKALTGSQSSGCPIGTAFARATPATGCECEPLLPAEMPTSPTPNQGPPRVEVTSLGNRRR